MFLPYKLHLMSGNEIACRLPPLGEALILLAVTHLLR